MRPFIIYALPRSRTFWLSRFLSYGDYECGHEQARYVRSMEDARSWLSQNCVGTAETTAAPWWRIIQNIRPDIMTLVVRRPVDEVVESIMRLDMRGVCTFDREKLTANMHRLDRRLHQIERCVPNVMSVRFSALAREDVCAAVFEHCLPYRHDRQWWTTIAPIILSGNMPALMRYFFAHKKQTDRVSALCLKQFRAILAQPEPRGDENFDGITIEQEDFRTFWRDGRELFSQHCLDVGEGEDQYLHKNVGLAEKLDEAGALQIMTARCNGRMFGYLMTIVGPSLESPDLVTATQTTFYASQDVPGLGMRIQKASIAALRERGVNEVVMRAGTRGSGRRISAMYRRLGATDHGHLFNLTLKVA